MHKFAKTSKIRGGELSPSENGGAAMRRGIVFAAIAALCVATGALADGLPDGYTKLPYIKANKNVQLKTGYTPKSTDKIVMTWCPTQVSTTECLWCARTNTSVQTFTAFTYKSAKIGIHINTTNYDGSSAPTGFTVNRNDLIAVNTKYTAIADGNAKTLTVTNAITGAEVVNVSWTVANNFDVSSQICLFASHGTNIDRQNNWASHYLYSFKVYDAAGTLKLNLVPAKNSSGAVGLYDTVGGSFKTKSNGSGSLSDTLMSMTYSDDTALDADVTFDGIVTVNSGKTLDLNGHNLTAYSIAGEGTITAGLRDLTSPDPDGERVTDTGTFYNTVGANLFNDNYFREADRTHRIIVNTTNLPVSVTYDFGEDSPKKVDMYKVHVGPLDSFNARAPKSWTFEGSNDKETWTPLDARDSETGWPRSREVRTYLFDNALQYRYYRITFTASNDTGSGNKYLEVVQLEYFDSADEPAVPPELRVNVPEGSSMTNSTVSIAGSVRLVKQGAGEFVANKPRQFYLGGTLVSEGTFKAMQVALPAGETGSAVQVEEGAIYDFNGASTSYYYGFLMNGGTLANTGADLAYDVEQIGGATLLADSYVWAPSKFGFHTQYDGLVTIDLGGHTLDVNGNDTIWIANTTFSNGTVRIASPSIALNTAASRADTATLDLSGTVGIYYDMPVSNLVLRSESGSSMNSEATGVFKVYGTFKTETGNFPFVKMMDGSTLNLKEWSGTFNSISANTANPNGYRLLFDSGATVTVDIAGRTPSVGDCLISWDAIPAGVTFQFDAATAAGGVEPVIAERGLLYGYVADTVEQAWWTGAANDGNIANPANWLCKNIVGGTVTGATALPTAVTHIYLEGSLNINDSTNLASICRVCTLTNATLAGDCDLRGLGAKLEISPNATINLNGRKFYVSAAAQIGRCTIKDANPVDLTTTDSSRVTDTGTFNGNTKGANLFNNNYSRAADSTHRIIINKNNLPVSVAYDFGKPTVVDAYRIWTGPITDYTSRLPMQWKIEGSNDGMDWTLLDYRKGVSAYGDENGHRTYSFANATAYNRYRITFEAAQWDSTAYLEAVQLEYFGLKATQGELHIDTTGVSGEVEFAGLSLDGNMRLFKEGAGTIRLSKSGQTHVGGMEVFGGTVVVGAANLAKASFGELGGDVVIHGDNAGAASATCGVVDFEAKLGYSGYRYILDGGAIYNPGLAVVTDLRLDSDSWLKLTDTTPANGMNYVGRDLSPSFVDLRGYTLSTYIEEGGRTLYLNNVTVDDGLVDVVSGGWFGSRGTIVATNGVAFKVNCYQDIVGTFLAQDYSFLATSVNNNRGDGIIDIYGTLSPNSSSKCFHGALLHGGSAIDLSGLSAALPTVAPFAASQKGDKTLRFEPGATIGVKLGSRTVAKGACVISWTAETAPDATVKFVPADADRKYRLVVESDGLYYYPPLGFMIIVQ